MVELRDQSFWVSGRGRWLVGSVRSVAVGGRVWACLLHRKSKSEGPGTPVTVRVGKKQETATTLQDLESFC